MSRSAKRPAVGHPGEEGASEPDNVEFEVIDAAQQDRDDVQDAEKDLHEMMKELRELAAMAEGLAMHRQHRREPEPEEAAPIPLLDALREVSGSPPPEDAAPRQWHEGPGAPVDALALPLLDALRTIPRYPLRLADGVAADGAAADGPDGPVALRSARQVDLLAALRAEQLLSLSFEEALCSCPALRERIEEDEDAEEVMEEFREHWHVNAPAELRQALEDLLHSEAADMGEEGDAGAGSENLQCLTPHLRSRL